jgi:hypothetical protein
MMLSRVSSRASPIIGENMASTSAWVILVLLVLLPKVMDPTTESNCRSPIWCRNSPLTPVLPMLMLVGLLARTPAPTPPKLLLLKSIRG